jgi:hypothetical protein
MRFEINSLTDSAVLVEADAVVVIGAHADIEWLGPK